MSQKYVVAYFVKPQVLGLNFHKSEWPSHITLLPLFSCTSSPKELTLKLEECATKIMPFEVSVEDSALFGPNRDVPVMLVALSKQLKHLHQELVETLSTFSTVFDNPEFVDQGYRPHITNQSNYQATQGQRFLLDSLALVDMYPNQDIDRREIISITRLGRPNE